MNTELVATTRTYLMRHHTVPQRHFASPIPARDAVRYVAEYTRDLPCYAVIVSFRHERLP